MELFYNHKVHLIKGGRHSTEVAFGLPTQPSLVRFSAFPNFKSKNFMLLKFIDSGTSWRVDSAKSLIVA